MVYYERGLQENFTESKIIKFDFDFAKKLKIEVGDDKLNRDFNENSLEINLIS